MRQTVWKQHHGGRATNLRSNESYNFTRIWNRYVEAVVKSRDSRRLINDEHRVLAQLIFDTLAQKNKQDSMIQSFKTFISSSIDYVHSAEKENWTVFIIIFIFKVQSMILNICNEELTKDKTGEIEKKINANILNIIDSVRTSRLIFKILSNLKDNRFTYSNQIFNITSYFCNKLLMLRPQSVQTKFFGFFKNDPR